MSQQLKSPQSLVKTESLELNSSHSTKRDFRLIFKREKENKDSKEKIFKINLTKSNTVL